MFNRKSFSIPEFYSIIRSKSYFNNINQISNNNQDELNKQTYFSRRSSSINIKGSTSTSSISSLLLKDDIVGSPSKRVRSSTTLITNTNTNNNVIGSGNTNNNNDNAFQIYFRRTHPWTSVFIPDNVDKTLEEVCPYFLYIFYGLLIKYEYYY